MQLKCLQRTNFKDVYRFTSYKNDTFLLESLPNKNVLTEDNKNWLASVPDSHK